MYNFEKLLNRNNNGSMKWNINYIKKRFPGVKEEIYPFFIADMDYRLPEEILGSFNEFITNGDFGYFHVQDDFNLCIKKWYDNLYKIKLKEEWIMPGIGTITTIKVALTSILKKGDNVCIFTPVYGPFRDVVLGSELNLIQQKLNLVEGEYKINFIELEETIIKENIKSILFCNPHNPSGRVWEKDEIDRLVNLCKKYSILLIGDEVHSDLILEGTFISLCQYFDHYDKIIVSSSPNKSFNLAGLNASYLLIGCRNNYEHISNELSKNKLVINRVGVNFLITCYSMGELWVRELRNNINDNIELAIDILSGSDVEIIRPKAGYLLWVKLNKVDDIESFTKELAKATGVLLEPGSRFISNYDGFVRINLATSKDNIKTGMIMLKDFYDKL
ncbi:MAG: MalY/PatB family protein [Clostridium sp.]